MCCFKRVQPKHIPSKLNPCTIIWADLRLVILCIVLLLNQLILYAKSIKHTLKFTSHQVIVKLVLHCSHYPTPVDPERHEEPEEKVDEFDRKILIEEYQT